MKTALTCGVASSPRCEHKDCASTREKAEVVCPDCGKPIGYEARFFLDPDYEDTPQKWRHLVHFGCLLGRKS